MKSWNLLKNVLKIPTSLGLSQLQCLLFEFDDSTESQLLRDGTWSSEALPAWHLATASSNLCASCILLYPVRSATPLYWAHRRLAVCFVCTWHALYLFAHKKWINNSNILHHFTTFLEDHGGEHGDILSSKLQAVQELQSRNSSKKTWHLCSTGVALVGSVKGLLPSTR